MKIKFSMREALDDDMLLGRVMRGPSWSAWKTLLIASRGEPLTASERKVFFKLTQRARSSRQPVSELGLIAGRRGGKSRALSVLATYLGGLIDYRDVLAPGETAMVLCIAPDQRQASIILNYCEAAFDQSPILRKLVKNKTSDTIELTNRISIEVRAASFRRLRGPTYAAVLLDEAAFLYSDESANPDVEIVRAVRPGLMTTGGPLVVSSSPYARRGELHSMHEKYYSKPDPHVLVAQGSTYDFNPRADKRVIERAFSTDPVSAAAEYGGEFRRDVEAFLSKEAVEDVVQTGVREIAPAQGIRYVGFTDPSGGSQDSFTLAVGHRVGPDRCVVDCVREVRPPFSPEGVCKEFATILKSYRIFRVLGDHYAGLWPVEQFSKYGIDYRQASKPKSELYLSLLAAINSQTVELLDNEWLKSQLVGLERRTSRAGRDSIDHGPGQHDDIANAVAGVTHEVLASHRERLPMSIHPPIIITGVAANDEYGYRNLPLRR